MRYVTHDGNYWIHVNDGTAIVGFTQQALDDYGPLLVVAPTSPGNRLISRGQSIAALEGVSMMNCFRSPVAGKLVKFTAEAEESPELITENSAIAMFVNVTDFSSLIPLDDNNNKDNDALSFL